LSRPLGDHQKKLCLLDHVPHDVRCSAIKEVEIPRYQKETLAFSLKKHPMVPPIRHAPLPLRHRHLMTNKPQQPEPMVPPPLINKDDLLGLCLLDHVPHDVRCSVVLIGGERHSIVVLRQTPSLPVTIR
jgi:hypothetical protein